MNRFLNILNLLGVLVLAGLLAAQWQANRTANLKAEGLEKLRLTHEAKLSEQAQTLEGWQADLEQLRQRLSGATAARDRAQVGLKKVSADLAQREAQNRQQKAQLALQTDQFQKELDQWQAAVKARDAALKQAGEQLQKLADDRNATVEQYNALAKRVNQLNADRNTAVEQFNEVVAKYNALAKQVEETNAKANIENAKALAERKKAGDNGAHLNVAP